MLSKTVRRVRAVRVAAGVAAFLLIGCNAQSGGPVIDATNATTLATSIQSITAEMPEVQRLVLVGDLALIQMQSDGAVFESTEDLYPEKNIRVADYSDMVIKSGSLIHNKTPDQVHVVATAIRREQTIRLLDELIADIESKEAAATKQIGCTRRAMDPAVNKYGYNALGWGETLKQCQSTVQGLQGIREAVQSRRQDAEAFDFSRSSVADAMDVEFLKQIRQLEYQNNSCSGNTAFCLPAEPQVAATSALPLTAEQLGVTTDRPWEPGSREWCLQTLNAADQSTPEGKALEDKCMRVFLDLLGEPSDSKLTHGSKEWCLRTARGSITLTPAEWKSRPEACTSTMGEFVKRVSDLPRPGSTSKARVELYSPPAPIKVVATGARMRAEPFSNAETEIVGGAPQGSTLDVVGRSQQADGVWYQIRMPDGRLAFVRSDLTSAKL